MPDDEDLLCQIMCFEYEKYAKRVSKYTHTHTYKLICTHLRSTLINNWNLFIPGSVKQMYVFICGTAYVGSDLSGNDDI